MVQQCEGTVEQIRGRPSAGFRRCTRKAVPGSKYCKSHPKGVKRG